MHGTFCAFSGRTVSRPNSQPGWNIGHKMIPGSWFGSWVRLYVRAIRYVLDDESLLDQPVHEDTQGVPVLPGSWDRLRRLLSRVDPVRISIGDLGSLQVGTPEHIAFSVPVLLCHAASEGIGTCQIVESISTENTGDLAKDDLHIWDKVDRVGMPHDIKCCLLEAGKVTHIPLYGFNGKGIMPGNFAITLELFLREVEHRNLGTQ